MAKLCRCGNVLDRELVITMICSPCRCSDPGKSRMQIGPEGIPSWMTEVQFNERRKHGMPLVTPAERAAFDMDKWQ